MKISLNWLKEHIDITEASEEIAAKLTSSGLEVESVNTYESVKGGLEGLCIGEVLECNQHPNADRLRLTKVDIGTGEPLPIVCGAPNVATGQKVLVATVGTTLYPSEGESFTIKKSKIRGEESHGMLCAEDEIGLGKSHDGILVLTTDLANGTPASQYLEIVKDEVIEIGLTPNRVDAASHFGVARELRALLNRSLRSIPVNLPEKKGAKNPINVVIDNKTACPRYSAALIRNVKVQESPTWLKERLKAIDVNPINNIVDITNYILHDLGQPLHAFDAANITSKTVRITTLPKGTKFKTLDEVDRKLNDFDLMICNDQEPMCIAGVFGGIDSGVSANTSDIFLESAYFNSDFVRKSSLAHGLKTDASFRFERGTDPRITLNALHKAIALIIDIAGGELAEGIIDLYESPIENTIVNTSTTKINQLIGITIPDEEIKRILSQLDIDILNEDAGKLTLSIPPYRVDVQRESDVVEEVLRIYGYDNIPLSPVLGSDFLSDEDREPVEKKKNTIASYLAANGMNEIITNSLTNPEFTKEDHYQNSKVEILNKLSEELGVMRQELLYSGLEVIAHNVNRKQKNLKLFEFGKTYEKTNIGYAETNHLALFVTGNSKDESWIEKDQTIAFHDLKNLVSGLLGKLGCEEVATKPTESKLLKEGLDILINNEEIGYVGAVHNTSLQKVNIKQAVFVAILNFDKLTTIKKKDLIYTEISKFPEVRRDLSLVLDKNVTYDQICAITKQVERKLIQSINVFDVFENEQQLGSDKKSYSVSYILQDKTQTLTDSIIDKIMEKLIKTYEKELNAIIRK